MAPYQGTERLKFNLSTIVACRYSGNFFRVAIDKLISARLILNKPK